MQLRARLARIGGETRSRQRSGKRRRRRRREAWRAASKKRLCSAYACVASWLSASNVEKCVRRPHGMKMLARRAAAAAYNRRMRLFYRRG